MSKLQSLNHPFYEVAAQADLQISLGHLVFQKFTCAYCGARQGIEEPNKFYKTATCEECGKLTNIEKDGCNFMLLIGNK
jgi:hypothetical protein